MKRPKRDKSTRPKRDKYFMDIAVLSAARSTCPRARVGAVAVRDNSIIMTAYNGAPKGHDHCDNVGCNMHNEKCIRTIHAEMNIVTHCAKNGIILEGATVYVTHEPCFHCMKLMIAAGVEKVIYLNVYKDLRTPNEYYHDIEVIKYEC